VVQGAGAGRDKLQAAWHYWDFGAGAEILAHKFIDNRIILVMRRDGNIWIEDINVDPGVYDAPLDYWIHLDRRTHTSGLAPGIYDAPTTAPTTPCPGYRFRRPRR
jgi:hypothetical protein